MVDKNNILNISVTLIKVFEGFKSKAYRDVGGVWTLGYGTTWVNGTRVEEGMECSIPVATEWLKNALEKEWLVLTQWIKKRASVSLNDNQCAALLSLIYNIGWQKFFDSTVAIAISEGRYPDAAKAFAWWNKVKIDGKLQPCDGLTKRREKEAALFMTPVVTP